MNEIIAQNHNLFYENMPVRIVMDENGEPWWVAKDVCDVLEYADTETALRKLDDDEKLIRKIYVSGQIRDVLTINESGFYTLVIRSNKPQAKPFRRWVTHEVLPSIRRTGAYVHPAALEVDDGSLKALADGLKDLKETVDRVFVNGISTKVMLGNLQEVRAAQIEPMNEFLDERFTFARGSVLRKDAIYSSYLSFCNQKRIVPSAKTTFFKDLYATKEYLQAVVRLIDGKPARCIKGLRFSEPWFGEGVGNE